MREQLTLGKQHDQIITYIKQIYNVQLKQVTLYTIIIAKSYIKISRQKLFKKKDGSKTKDDAIAQGASTMYSASAQQYPLADTTGGSSTQSQQYKPGVQAQPPSQCK